MKKLKSINFIILFLLFSASVMSQQIIEIDNTKRNVVKVTINPNNYRNESAWIGCSIRYQDDGYVDFKVQKTDPSKNIQIIHLYPDDAYLSGWQLKEFKRNGNHHGNSPTEVIVALWKDKVTKEECIRIKGGKQKGGQARKKKKRLTD